MAGHTLFEIEAIDRMYLNLYQPRLRHGAGAAAFFVGAPGQSVRLLGADGPDVGGVHHQQWQATLADEDHSTEEWRREHWHL